MDWTFWFNLLFQLWMSLVGGVFICQLQKLTWGEESLRSKYFGFGVLILGLIISFGIYYVRYGVLFSLIAGVLWFVGWHIVVKSLGDRIKK